MAASIARHHAEWLSLVETSGPFLSVPVLSKALPQGLDATRREAAGQLRTAREELDDDPSLSRAWCEFVLGEILEFGDALVAGAQIPTGQEYRSVEHADIVRPDMTVVSRGDGDAPQPLLHVTVHDVTQDLDRRLSGANWAASPIDRMAALCRSTAVPLGLTTNGQSWSLIYARAGEATGVCTWDADLWLEEPLTLRAFCTLLGAHRFFSVPEEDMLPALLEQSARNQQEVTDRLGAQVRQAVELLIDALDRADHDRDGELLGGIPNEELYRAAVTVMMRLVFLFVAEERQLLPLDDALYAESYAASTLRGQLEEHAARFGEDPLERSSAAWSRLLALSRAVHGGIEHETLRLPAYGGSLFDPDRYPFLEGREDGTNWRNDAAAPLPVDDRTVLHLLSALQLLTEPGRSGFPPTTVRLSFRALDVEQIGHIYEGLLDHTAVRTFDAAVGLVGNLESEVSLKLLEDARSEGDDSLAAILKAETGKSPAAIQKALALEPDHDRSARLLSLCDNDPDLRDRILPFLGLIRDDLRGNPRVFLPGALYVTKTLERRSSGTYYTPRSMAEDVARHALDPVAYSPGPADARDPADWKLRPASELLDLKVADIAMGSGAFLVAAARYLAARLLEAWEQENRPIGIDVANSVEQLSDPLPVDPLERETLAFRLVSERCIYGVDKNPMAVEMAKLSLWLVTLAKDRPFSFLDHSLREGDSLLGVTSLEQLRFMHIEPTRGRSLHANLLNYTSAIAPAIDQALALRAELESFVVRDIVDTRRKLNLNARAVKALDDVRLLADIVIGSSVAHADGSDLDSALTSVEARVPELLAQPADSELHDAAKTALQEASERWLQSARPDPTVVRKCFHWSLEYPEVDAQGGFDAIVGNPPFLGNKYWKDVLGPTFQRFAKHLLAATPGKIDLAVLFHRRSYELLAPRGSFGLLGSTQSAEGQAISVGLSVITQTGAVMRAVRGLPWPGDAKVRVNLVWVRKGEFNGVCVLDGVAVDRINATLSSGAEAELPKKLDPPDLWAFEGVHNAKGAAFLLEETDPWFPQIRQEGSGLLRPYISGEDLGTRPIGIVKRWAVDTGDEELDAISTRFPLVHQYLLEVVQPSRDAETLKPYRGLSGRWWQFWNSRAKLYRRLREKETCIVLPKVAMFVLPARAPTQWCYTNKVVLIEESRADMLGVLRSAAFREWVYEYATSFGVGSGISPSISKGLNTFVMPPVSEAMRDIGERWHVESNAWCSASGNGLTSLENDLHSSTAAADELRAIQRELDEAVMLAYGWPDIDLDHGFHEGAHGARFGVSEKAREEMLMRLLRLNHSKATVEAKAKSVPDSRANARRSDAGVSAGQATIFDNV